MARAMERVARHVDCAVVSSVTLDELADASSFHSVTTPRLDTLRNLAAGEAATAAKLEAKVLLLAHLCVVVHTALTAGPWLPLPSPPLPSGASGSCVGVQPHARAIVQACRAVMQQ